MSHASARLNAYGRWLRVQRIRVQGRPVAHVARELGVSRQCAHRWVARFDARGPVGLVERSSRPHHCPRRTSDERVAVVLTAREVTRRGPDELARVTGVPARTVSRILRRARVPYLWQWPPVTGALIRASKTTTVRYEHDHPGDLVHIDIKKLGRIPAGGGWKLHGREAGDTAAHKRARIGFDYIHSAVDDHSRLASLDMRLTLATAAIEHWFIKAHCPWQNGKVERFNRTLATEWAYAQPWLTNDDRTAALATWLEHDNNHRHHSAVGAAPITRLSPT